ncbi:histidine ammonia-lyase [candidate division WOR-3 bacterium]|nr:histidine ammonia-lyase [candidate division WOR-3 bacterium]
MVTLNGSSLTIEQVWRIACQHEAVRLARSALSRVRACERYLAKHLSDRQSIYGFNTGFGALAHVHINTHDLAQLQENILLSHNAGIGPFFAPEFVRAALLLRINTLIQGYSGVSIDLVKTLTQILNRNIVPLVPQKGSVGASGDLAPMAAIGIVVLGKGNVFVDGHINQAKQALARFKIKPIKLKAKEGLALINGTQFSTGICSLVYSEAMNLCSIADICGALSLEALKGTDRSFDPLIFKLRRHPGAEQSARRLRTMLRGSSILKSHRDCSKVQDTYSLRCMPQVHGAVYDLLEAAHKTITIEINAVTDNPIIVCKEDRIISNGNFHGEPIAFALDTMAIGLSELAGISERRIFRLLDGSVSRLNPFLAKDPGLNSGFMLAQVTAAALVSQNKILSHPASVDSIPTSANQEDHVSMSMNAGLKAIEVLDNVKYVLAIELLCACQAIELLKPLKTSPRLQKIHSRIRKIVPFLEKDSVLTEHIENLKTLIDNNELTSFIP